MVDVSGKETTVREARAQARVKMSPATAALVDSGNAPKGDVVSVARLAAIQAAKRTDELIPLAHPLLLDHIDVSVETDVSAGCVTVTAAVRTSGRTGVEMEAMTACSIGALAIYDMVKGVERGVTVESLRLLEKTGGKLDWHADSPQEPTPYAH